MEKISSPSLTEIFSMKKPKSKRTSHQMPQLIHLTKINYFFYHFPSCYQTEPKRTSHHISQLNFQLLTKINCFYIISIFLNRYIKENAFTLEKPKANISSNNVLFHSLHFICKFLCPNSILSETFSLLKCPFE